MTTIKVGLLVTNPYQLQHYRRIAFGLPAGRIIVELRETDYGVTEDMIRKAIPGWDIEYVPQDALEALDGAFDALLCQTPILPMHFLTKTRVIAQQYSLAKEHYQYGLWRAHADYNLMYGPYSTAKVSRFANAKTVGNPLFDGTEWWTQGPPVLPRRRLRVLFLPTYGDLSTPLEPVFNALHSFDATITIKPHHSDSVPETLQDRAIVATSAQDPIELIRANDVIVSDLSGAAYDAIAMRRPTILLRAPLATHSRDFKRLSPADIDRLHTRDLAVAWTLGEQSFSTSVEQAYDAATDNSAYERFVDSFYLRTQEAGGNVAQAILDSHDVKSHPVGAMIDESLSRHITENRELRRVNRTLRDRNPVWMRVVWRIRRRIAGVPGVRSLTGWLRVLRSKAAQSSPGHHLRRLAHAMHADRREASSPSRDQQPTIQQIGQMAPAIVRRQTADSLRESMETVGIDLAWGGDDYPDLLAVRSRDIRQFVKAIRVYAKDSNADSRAIVMSGRRRLRSVDASDLTFSDCFLASHVLIGHPVEVRDYRLASRSYAQVHIVEHDDLRKRWLARDTRAEIADWTAYFESEPTARTSISSPSPRHKEFSEPIDLVYTWVDSSDPRWNTVRQKHTGEISTLTSAANAERFAERDELRYSLRSVEAFAPWVRHVYIVTDAQSPKWLANSSDITVIDHREIFPDPSVLPVFNSHAIEACLHRIDSLSERYLYLNDDVLFGSEVSPEDFFTKSGLIKIYLSPSQFVYDGRPTPQAIPTDWAAYNVKECIERDFAVSVRRRVKHVPYGSYRSLMFELEERYPEAFSVTRASRFRSPTDFAVPSMLAPYYAIATRHGVEWPNARYQYVYADTGRLDWFERIDVIRRRRPQFFCINATRHDEIPLDVQGRNIRNFLDSYLPLPSRFEVADP